MQFKFDPQKAINQVLYVAQSLKESGVEVGLHKLFKVLYFADQKHMAQYGRPISGDHYVAMNYGPVPSNTYDILKSVRGDSYLIDGGQFADFFNVSKYLVDPKKAPDMDFLSESEIECLDLALQENKCLSFLDLTNKSHDPAYMKAAKDDKISFREMAKAAGASQEMLVYMHRMSENQLLVQ